MMNNNSLHTGHRDRLRQRFIKEGLDGFNEINALELLLFYCVPRKDTNDLAHRLLDRFGSYSNVLNAPYEELKKVYGVSDYVATYLKLQGEAVRYYLTNRKIDGTVVRTSADYGELLCTYFEGRPNEMVFLLCLDAKCKVICCREIAEGSVNIAGVSIRKIVDAALSSNATSVVLAHNHPSGIAVPSGEDIHTTFQAYEALRAVEVILLDHIIVADGDFTSMVESGLFRVAYQ